MSMVDSSGIELDVSWWPKESLGVVLPTSCLSLLLFTCDGQKCRKYESYRKPPNDRRGL